MSKERLDELIVSLGHARDLVEARGLIMSGLVSTDAQRLDKPGQRVDSNIVVHVKARPRFVSRAGEKLASVFEFLKVDFQGQSVLDVGSSTGGFTDFALQHGARLVFCVDVGTGQLAYKLRKDRRVVAMERTDIRDVSVGEGSGPQLTEQADMAVVDVSFVSLTEVLQSVAKLVRPGGLVVAMVKPQFEASRIVASRYKGVIPLGPVRDGIISEVRDWCRERFKILDERDSGVAGSEGNVERFFVLRAKRD